MSRDRIRFLGWSAAAAVLVFLGDTCAAQTNAGARDFTGSSWNWFQGGGNGGMSIASMMKAGGSLMWVIAVLSIVGVAMIGYLFFVLRPGQVAQPGLHRNLVKSFEDGDMDSSRQLCEDNPSPLSAVALAAIDHIRSTRVVNDAILKDIIEGEGSRQAEDIQGQTQYLLDLAVVAPMVGLLGTVFGMLHAFGGIANDIASAKPVVLAEGVAMALLTTAFGLIVGIPAMAFYSYFRRLAAKLAAYLELAATDLFTSLINRPSRGPDAGVQVRPADRKA